MQRPRERQRHQPLDDEHAAPSSTAPTTRAGSRRQPAPSGVSPSTSVTSRDTRYDAQPRSRCPTGVALARAICAA